MRVCTKCKIEKDESKFNKHSKMRDGLDTQCKACKSEYKKINKESIKVKSAEWQKRNRNNRNKKQAERLKNDPIFKLTRNLRIRINKALRRNTKSAPTVELIGCTIEFFKKHIESLFTEGMTWDNYGLYGWHLDHIKPCAAFDLNDPEQQRQCEHWSNQQPLWATDNLSKSCKWMNHEESDNELV